MKAPQHLAIAISLAIIAGCTAYVKNRATISPGISVQLPNGVEITSRRPVEDFDIHSFKLRESLLLSAYTGNAPPFPMHAPDSSDTHSILINGLRASCIDWVSGEDSFSRECLIELGDEGFPTRLHFWYDNLGATDKQLSDGIIHSTKREATH